MQDTIGNRGEALFYTLMTRFYDRSLPLFRPQFLGAKFATVDYMVELMDAGDTTPFFFVQVKTTTQGYTRKEHRLKVQVLAEDLRRLIAYPAPTYIVGVDERQETGYFVAACDPMPNRLASLATTFPLTLATLEALWQEVHDFWHQRDMRFRGSRFAVP
jgi:hypothetical protein